MGNDNHIGIKPRIVADRLYLIGKHRPRILITIVRVAHAGEIHGGNTVVIGESRRNEIPPAGMRVHAVYQ